MGNLSCVSCKGKEKQPDRSIGELSCGDHKTAGITNSATNDGQNNDGGKFVKNSASQSHTSPVELYDLLRGQRLKDDEFAQEFQKLDDVQKAARAIVDMTVYLTTQVIFPAYLRYLKEDHPSVYTEYYEKSLVPAISYDNAITVGGELS